VENEIKLYRFAKFIPKSGICVYPKVWYYDANYIPDDVRKAHKHFFHTDNEYKEQFDRKPYCYWINLDAKQIGTRYCAYIYRKDVCIGSIYFTEHFDNPDGYTKKGDFQLNKWIYPEFRRTIYSRYALGDLIHMLFISGLANRLYAYQEAREDWKVQEELWQRIDNTTPCRGIKFPSDTPEVRPYIRCVKMIHTKVRDFVLTEFNGDIYRSMDLKKYLMAPPGRTKEVVDRWIVEMNEAAEKVRKEVNRGAFKV